MGDASEVPAKARRKRGLQGVIMVFSGAALLAYTQHNPIHSTLSNGLILADGGAILIGAFLLTWSWPIIRWLLFATVAFATVLPFLPGWKIDTINLRMRYIANLQSFEGTPYVWGGEAHNGVDCSGLPRRAWREALFSEGVATLNGRLLRLALDSWWNDASARELAQGDGGRTIPVSGESTLAKMDASQLQPGDLAITTSGVHMLVYFGSGKWIEADPVVHHVIIFDPKKDKNDWTYAPVNFFRWRELNEG